MVVPSQQVKLTVSMLNRGLTFLANERAWDAHLPGGYGHQCRGIG